MIKLKERGFTDKLYFLNLTLSWLFIIVCIVMTALEGELGITDLSIASVGIPAVFAELGVHTGFIVWKAKTENINKYGDRSSQFDSIDDLTLVNPPQSDNTMAIGFRIDSEEENNL